MSLPHAVVRTDHHSAQVLQFNAKQVQTTARIVDCEVADHPSENQLVAVRPPQTAPA
jgi:hypothetical protein